MAEASDRMLSEFQKVQTEVGQTFTYDAACNCDGSNKLCESFACPDRSFFDQEVSGEMVWINPLYTRITEWQQEWQQHYAACKAKAPERTGAMFVAPKWPHVEQLFKSAGYTLFKTYAADTVLFTGPTQNGSCQPCQHSVAHTTVV